MTRRLDPQDRIDELGSASVPFNFDVHAMIFSDNAPALEAALHRAFEDRKLNMVNHRREFFHVTLDEIKDVVRKNFDKTVEFTDVPDAEQYRISLKLRAEQPQEQPDRTIDFFTPSSSPSVKQKTSSVKSPIGSKKYYTHVGEITKCQIHIPLIYGKGLVMICERLISKPQRQP